jgi:two-component system, cell cycle sensor histidine kinase DivJ
LHCGEHIFLGDARRIKQIFINLLSNAIKFTLEGGKVVLDASVDAKNCFCFVVQDNGVGIPRDRLSSIAEPFTQVHNDSDTTNQPGTGLGLYLVKQLTELHGGSLLLESEEGKGTRVSIVMPRYRTR